MQLFTDVYPMPDEGWHFMAAIGAAGMTCKVGTDGGSLGPGLGGFGATVGGGWEGWIGEQWSLGALLSLSWIRVTPTFRGGENTTPEGEGTGRKNDSAGKTSAVLPTLGVALTYH